MFSLRYQFSNTTRVAINGHFYDSTDEQKVDPFGPKLILPLGVGFGPTTLVTISTVTVGHSTIVLCMTRALAPLVAVFDNSLIIYTWRFARRTRLFLTLVLFTFMYLSALGNPVLVSGRENILIASRLLNLTVN